MIEYKVKVYPSGTKHWLLNDELHREDGPAVEYASGDKFWFLHGKNLTEPEWQAKTSKPLHEGREVEIDGVTYVLKRKG